MLLKYKGDGKRVSFITDKVYSAEKIFDEMGEDYAIFDEGEDWYRYGIEFVTENFEKLSGSELSDPSEKLSKLA